MEQTYTVVDVQPNYTSEQEIQQVVRCICRELTHIVNRTNPEKEVKI